MQSTSGKQLGSNHALAILAFVVAGLVYSPLFFAGALLIGGLAIARRNKPLGYSLGVLGLVCFLFMLGYGIGKDMAYRDKARSDGIVVGAGS